MPSGYRDRCASKKWKVMIWHVRPTPQDKNIVLKFRSCESDYLLNNWLCIQSPKVYLCV